jgi:fatty-acyl-CoA synthase
MSGVASGARLGVRALSTLRRAGVLAPVRPDRLGRILAAGVRLAPGIGSLAAAAAARHPDQAAIADERGVLSYGELDASAAALAAALHAELGVGPERSLAIMCRNHRGFLESLLAGSRVGADLLLLNTDFPGPQLAQVLERERPAAAVLDEEFWPAFEAAGFAGGRVVAWHDGDPPGPTADDLAGGGSPRGSHSRRQGRIVILTSGTTGTPKGAGRRPSPLALVGPMVTMLSQLDLRTREGLLVGPPFFHGFGLGAVGLGMLLGSTLVVRRRFDPEWALAAIEEQRVTALVAVPVMLQRILALPEEVRSRYDTASLRTALSAAAPLSPRLAEEFTRAFGDVLYNAYGSTETGFGAIATPADLRAAPGTVGRPPFGVTVKILDERRRELRTGEVGHVFMGGELVFDGYSGGGTKEVVDGLMNTGDLGHLDGQGRLFIDGREDDMIVSGGENVFPQEVEEVLRSHEAVADVAVIGVDDEEFGQRLEAYVVAGPGASPSRDELKAHVKRRLARYKVPREIVFLGELPRNPTGKIVRSELAKMTG